MVEIRTQGSWDYVVAALTMSTAPKRSETAKHAIKQDSRVRTVETMKCQTHVDISNRHQRHACPVN
jgi:hypothetical protein